LPTRQGRFLILNGKIVLPSLLWLGCNFAKSKRQILELLADQIVKGDNGTIGVETQNLVLDNVKPDIEAGPHPYIFHHHQVPLLVHIFPRLGIL